MNRRRETMPEKKKKDALLPSTMIHVDPLQQYMLRLTKEMTFAKHGVGKQMELAAFYLLVTLIEENHLAQTVIRYSFDALELADMLGINPGQGRGRYVANLFRALRREEILLPDFSKVDRNEKDISFSAYGYLNGLEYDATTKRLDIEIHPRVNDILFQYKTSGGFVAWDDIRTLSKSRNALQLFVFLHGLDIMDIHSVTFDQIRDYLGLVGKYMNPQDFKKKLLLPAAKTIRQLAGYESFSLTTNGERGGAPADRVFFHFSEKKIALGITSMYDFSKLSPTQYKDVSSVSMQRQTIIGQALQAGFQPTYLRVLLNYRGQDDMLQSEVTHALTYCKNHQITRPEEIGGIINKAVTKGWVANSPKLTKKAEKQKQTRDRLRKQKAFMEAQDEARSDAEIAQKAKHYFDQLSDQALYQFAQEHKSDIQRLMNGRAMDIQRLLKRDGRASEVRSVRRLIKSMLLAKTLDMEEKPSLFSMHA